MLVRCTVKGNRGRPGLHIYIVYRPIRLTALAPHQLFAACKRERERERGREREEREREREREGERGRERERVVVLVSSSHRGRRMIMRKVIGLINPQRTCAARVTVVVLCVCLSTTIHSLQATRRLMSDTNATRARKIMWRFC